MSHRNVISLAIAVVVGISSFVLTSTYAKAHRHRAVWHPVVATYYYGYGPFPKNYWGNGNYCWRSQWTFADAARNYGYDFGGGPACVAAAFREGYWAYEY
jgi:hypothetical protein